MLFKKIHMSVKICIIKKKQANGTMEKFLGIAPNSTSSPGNTQLKGVSLLQFIHPPGN